MFRQLCFRKTSSRWVNRVRFNHTSSTPPPSKSSLNLKFALVAGVGVLAGVAISNSMGGKYTKKASGELAPSTLPLAQLSSPIYANDYELKKALDEIRNILPDSSISNTQSDLDAHSDTYFNSHHPSPEEKPKFVVYPESTGQVAEILKICNRYRVPVVPISGGSSLEGHFVHTRKGLCLDLSRMNQIITLNKDDLDVTVQGGVGWEELADYLSEYELFFGPDPGPGANIAGMCATSCSGTNAYRYGTMKENVLGLTAVLADGTIIKTKKRPRKSSAGYNLTGLMIGSEGTLGIITEATLKLNVKPLFETVAVIPFKHIDDAAMTVTEFIQKGVQLNAVELLDDKMMKCINDSGETSKKWSENPTLFIKVGGLSDNIINSLIKEVKKISSKHNSLGFEFAKDDEEKYELWSARKVALWSTINQGKLKNPDAQLWTTDAAVPFSNLPKFLKETKEDIDNHGLSNTLVAHIGDGNAHSFIVYDPKERAKAELVVDRMVQRAIDYEGTCTGEHGIGLGKRAFLIEEIGELPVDMMRQIKLSLDPLRIMNPDKVFKIDPNEKGHDH